jgi:hypothetical protein
VTPAFALLAAACPVLAPAPQGEGTAAVLHTPSAEVMALNNEGKALYRQARWAEARSRYQAALAADPEWLAPALNAACALARQERFADAAGEAAALIRRAYVPWGRETLEAADLATLHVRPEMDLLRTAAAEAARAWGASLGDGLFFVARTRPAVKLEGQGVLVLGLNQEVFAWLPATGRYRQVTSDDGRVLAAVRPQDGRSVVYVRAGKLVRAPQSPPRLRGLALRRLDLTAMTSRAPVEVPGDVEELSLWSGRGAAVELRVRSAEGVRQYQLIGETLAAVPALSPETRGRRPVRLTAAGVDEPGPVSGPAGCPFRAGGERPAGQPPRVRVTAGKRSVVLDAPLGAGLYGLPFVTSGAGAARR